MASMPWIKFYTDFLDDPKIGQLGDRQKLRFAQLLLLAGECDMDGLLVNGEVPLTAKDIAWRLRAAPSDIEVDISALASIGLVAMDGEAIVVVNFAKRQGRSQEERRAQWRESKRRARDVQQDSNRTPVGVQLLEERREDKSRGEERESAQEPPALAPIPASATVTPAPTHPPPPTVSAPEELKAQPKPATQAQAARKDKAKMAEPAILAYGNIFGAYEMQRLNPAQVAAILRAVTDVPKWGGVCKEWAERGYKPGNVQGMLEVYAQGWRIAVKDWPGAGKASKNGRTFIRPQVQDSTPDEVEQARAEARRRIEERAARRAARP